MVRFLLPDQIRLYGPETFFGTVLSDVGFELGDHAWNDYSTFLVSSEQLEPADADVVFSTSYGVTGAPEDDPTFDAVRTLWASVPAVAAARPLWVDNRVWMLGIGLLAAEHL